MKKVITYGTYDLIHRGHIRLLERAKALGDYLIVGVTADGFDRTRGKINVVQSLMERIEGVRNTGLADEIVVEEYEGQKIDDIRRFGVDIFAIGSDWVGKFDYLNEFCHVVYLDRTEGVSSTEIRSKLSSLRLGIIGESNFSRKVIEEGKKVNGIIISGVYSKDSTPSSEYQSFQSVDDLLEASDAVYVYSIPYDHYELTKKALQKGKHVLCESPIALSKEQASELLALAKEKDLVLFDGIKTGYSIAYYRLLLLLKSGIIGDVVSISSTCTSLSDLSRKEEYCTEKLWNSITDWGPTGLLPIFQILGTDYKASTISSRILSEKPLMDSFTKISLVYENAVADVLVGKGIKSEGELIIAGTNGYVFVPAPWWKTEYFEVRYEDSTKNRRYFYQLEGEGIRYELLAFFQSIEKGISMKYIEDETSLGIVGIMEKVYNKEVNRL
ncbi:MAG: Gfo/Idh/MocA family oxidoreductase [Spirochaetales bacterium]|nr:Gfo/Idh/MocA family oxidoreductase [Candidatus Physcosoma equi]